ncbi:MAG: TonB-dependent receptor [Bacteroidia bacterium]|nr:TonB-dependent receptor [Bacteroidia bacterium]
MKFSIYITAFVLFLGLGFSSSFAQGDNNPLQGKDSLVLENERIEDVIDSNKPTIKIKYQEIKQGKDQQVEFNSKPYKVEVDFEPIEPKILPIETRSKEDFTNNYLRVGVGRFLTPAVDLYINNGQDKTVDYGFLFKHLSAHNDIVPLRNFRQDQGTLTAKGIRDDNEFKAKLYVYNTAYWNYAGDDTTLFPGEAQPREDSLRMSFTRFALDGQVASVYDRDRGYHYDVGAGIKGLGSRRGNNEFHVNLTPTGGFYFGEDGDLNLESEVTYIRANIADAGQNRFFVHLNPSFIYQKDKLSLKAGVDFAYFTNSADSMGFTNLGPDIEVAYQILPNSLTALVGVTAGMVNNNLYDMFYENPYLAREIPIQPTLERLHFYGGIKGNLNQAVDYSIQAFHKRRENQLIYRSVDSVYFEALYDSFTTISGLHAELNHDISSHIVAGAALNINVYTTSNQDSMTQRFFHAVPFRIDAFAQYKTLEDKLTARADMNFYGPTPFSVDENGEILSRNAFLNLGAKVDFRPIPALSVYVGVNNLLNGRYQRWFNYPERGIDFMGGLTLSF